MTGRGIPWPIAGVIAGAAGTAAMTLAYKAEHIACARRSRATRLRRQPRPGPDRRAVLHLPSVTERGEQELGTLLRWGYGSAFGMMHGFLRRRLGEPWASAIFGGMLMSATFSLFPLLGRTPPPWRWKRDVLATSLGTHAAYVAGVALTNAALAADDDG